MAVQEEENVLKLFDSYWFQNSIFTNRNPCHQIDEKEEIEKEEEEPLKLSRLPTLHIRSMSDHVLTSQTSFTSDNSHSPTTVLSTAPRLQPILSGKEVGDFVEPGAKHEEMILEIPIKKKVSGTMGRRRRRRRKASSRSLSELEFEELKGFMDLGFVFSEEDKDSRLVSIIPGLQRLGRKGSGAVEKEEDDGDVSKLSADLTSKVATSGPVLTNSGVAEVLKSAQEPLCEALSKLSSDLTSKSVTSAPVLTNSGVAEVFKSAQEPLNAALSKLSADLTSKAMTSAPVLAELVDCFSKMGLSYMNLGSQIQVGAESGSGTTETPMAVPVTENPKSAKNDAREVFGSTTPKVAFNSSKKDVSRAVATPVIPTPVATPVIPAPTYVDLNLDHLGNSTLVNAGPVAPSSLVGEKGKETGVCKGMSGNFYSPINAADSKKPCHPVSPVPFNECPFSGMPLADESAFPFVGYPRVHPFKRSHTHGDFMAGIFHKGIRCDGCGVHPITGPRFKSTVKEDYDLCSICFAEMGNEADYIRLDRPVVSRHYKGLLFPHAHPGARALKAARKLNSRYGLDLDVNAPPVLRGCGLKAACKLNSRFVLDVNVMDGTLMPPLTPFTKIWRMRNNGTFAWPRGTQLLWIGGDKISGATSVEIEIPSAGVAVGRELDIAVDCIAPVKPGQYISYWRMASQSGQKFGQRIWVLVHVDASLKDYSIHESEHGINLNLPPVNGVSKAPETEIFDMNVKLEDDTNIPGPSNTAANQIMVYVGEDGNKDQELNFPINDNLLVGDGVKNSVPVEVVPSVVSYPIIDLSEVPQVVPSMTPSPAVDVVTSSENDVEKNLLHELEEMGFKQVELNKEVLRMNEYNLEQSLDHLCGVAEWDPILEELDEMGFCDKEMNKKLLAKNNGSIKRVVMDLISGEGA